MERGDKNRGSISLRINRISIISNKGSIPIDVAKDAEMGINNAALAVLLTISLVNIATATITRITTR